jgi:hypothetical protein
MSQASGWRGLQNHSLTVMHSFDSTGGTCSRWQNSLLAGRDSPVYSLFRVVPRGTHFAVIPVGAGFWGQAKLARAEISLHFSLFSG